jgi:ATP-dependent RNA helicase DeaD
MEEFKKLNLSSEILESLKEQKFEKPTEVQEKSIPPVLQGKDVIAEAATGSGKTLAFGAGIIQNCSRQGIIQSLVLVPTRELADQVAKTIRLFSKFKSLEIVDVYGGVAISPQMHKLRRADVVVGTPGRILDHLDRQTIDLRYVKILVLDEADRMLDMGFIDDVKKIISYCPEKRQTLLFSATISKEITDLAEDYMNSPQTISCESQVDPSKLKQCYYDTPDNLKFSLLVHLLKSEKAGLIMVFCNTQRNTDFVAKNLQRYELDAIPIHGGHSQEKRSRAMNTFHANKAEILVCTDVAARGLDIKNVSHVYNYDIPNEPKQYIHRIGRTARAGAEGKAVNLLASRDYDNFAAVKKYHPEMFIERLDMPIVEKVFVQFEARKFRRGFGGDRRGDHSDPGSRSYGGNRSRGPRRSSRDSRFSRRY